MSRIVTFCVIAAWTVMGFACDKASQPIRRHNLRW